MIREGDDLSDPIIDGRRNEDSVERTIEKGKKTKDRDTLILADLAHLKDRGIVDTIITNDKNHMYSRRDRINTAIGVNLQYIKDEVADPSLP